MISESNLRLGDKVRHISRPEVGVGIITNILEDGKVTAEFQDFPTSPIHTNKPFAVFTGISPYSLKKEIKMNSEQIYQYIIELADELISEGRRMKLSELVNHLNENCGTSYTPGEQGIGQVVKAAWNRANDNQNKVANAFVCSNGLPCWQ